MVSFRGSERVSPLTQQGQVPETLKWGQQLSLEFTNHKCYGYTNGF